MTIDIPKKELKEVIKHTGAKTKKGAILQAVTDYNRRQRLAKLAEKLGTFENFMTLKELYKLRKDGGIV